MKILILSSLAQNTGCFLRANYIADSLKYNGDSVEVLNPLKKNLPLMLDLIISLPLNIFRVLFSDYDIYMGIKPFPNVTIPLILKKILNHKKIIIDIDDLDSGYRKGILSQINSLSQRPFPKHFDLVTYHNALLKKYIQTEFLIDSKKMYKLDQGVDLKIFDFRRKNLELRRKFANDNEKIVTYMGHLNIASDLDDIIRAIKIIYGKKKFIFLVAGGGPEESTFKELAKELDMDVKFTGHLKNQDIADYVSIADLCLVYYKDKVANYYRCSMKLRECMAMGKKIVCDDIGELKKFKKYTYQTGPDLNEYANKILETLDKGDNREKLGRLFIEKNLDWKKLGAKFLKTIKKI